MASRPANNRFRQRKLSTKQNLAILRESEVEATFDDEASRNIPKVETGVEKSEEIEHHLQAVISSQATGSASAAYIPTPPTNLSGVQYERLYSPAYVHPQTYIRFSSTVEETSGCPYCMNQEDFIFLLKLNSIYQKAATSLGPCAEDQFEEVMAFFEETSSLKQPYATLDNTPVLPYSEMYSSFDDTIDNSSRIFAKDIYEHWKNQRLERQNHPLMPAVKFERNAETDDADPYVCFRRREVRQARKTRGRDAQITEKLKKLRQELEQARQLLNFTKQREGQRRDQIMLDKLIFTQRCFVKEAKRNLGIKTNDDHDILINQKPVDKLPKPDPALVRMPMVPKVPMRSDGRLQDHDLQLLSEDRKKKEVEVENVIQDSMTKHRNWNSGWFDDTWRPITPPLETSSRSSFRTAFTEFLPTPPSSDTSEHAQGGVMIEPKPFSKPKDDMPFRYESPPVEIPTILRPSFRRRLGRGGRVWMDRRDLQPKPNMTEDEDINDRKVEMAQYDAESDEDSEIYHTDPYDTLNLRYRINFSLPSGPNSVDAQRRLLEAQRRGLVGSQAMPRPQVSAVAQQQQKATSTGTTS